LFGKMKDSWKDAASTAAEGLTYVSGMGNVMERAADASRVSSWLPEDTPLNEDCRVVFVDIETTGFKGTDDVVQIAAKCEDRNSTFTCCRVRGSTLRPRGLLASPSKKVVCSVATNFWLQLPLKKPFGSF